jgi:hypothetical protein
MPALLSLIQTIQFVHFVLFTASGCYGTDKTKTVQSSHLAIAEKILIFC